MEKEESEKRSKRGRLGRTIDFRRKWRARRHFAKIAHRPLRSRTSSSPRSLPRTPQSLLKSRSNKNNMRVRNAEGDL